MNLYNFFCSPLRFPLVLIGLEFTGVGLGGSKGTTNWYRNVFRPMHARAKMQSFLRGP